MHNFRGVYSALITPFTDIGTVDYQALEKIVDYQIEAGIDGLVPCGTTGESPTLSHEEHDRVIAKTIQYAKGRVPIIAGTGSNATTEAIRLSQHAEDAGADAVLLVNPYYNKPTQKGIYKHFECVCNSTDLPIIIYNIPGRTGVNISPSTVHDLFNDFENIIGIKEASGNLSQIDSLIMDRPKNFSVLSGDDALTFSIMSLGGNGVISVASNACPALMRTLVSALQNNDLDKAVKAHHLLLPINRLLFKDGNPAGVKALLSIKGMIKNVLRLPLLPAEENTYEALTEFIGVK